MGVRKLFGTDGVRGVAGQFLTAELALALARAATARVAAEAPRVLVIRDTRESGEMLEAAVAAGVAAAGGEALLGGVLPTPGAPLLIRRHGLDLGVVLSASHNPYEDNGIKFFGGDARGHRGLEHLTGLARVADDQHPRRPLIGAADARRGGTRERQGELRREELARYATDTVGAEVLARGAGRRRSH